MGLERSFVPVNQEGSETRLVSQSQTNFVQPRDPHSSLYCPSGFIINLAGHYRVFFCLSKSLHNLVEEPCYNPSTHVGRTTVFRWTCPRPLKLCLHCSCVYSLGCAHDFRYQAPSRFLCIHFRWEEGAWERS